MTDMPNPRDARRGLLFILSSPSGAGKSTLARRLLADDPAAVVDVPHFCNEAGHELAGQDSAGDHQVYLIRKSGS